MDPLLEPIKDTEEHPFCNKMMKRLDIQRRNEQFCDVILQVGSGDDQARLKAHRNVLCAASPFFYNALNIDMKEKQEGVIRLEKTSKVVMEKVLDYLYTGHVEITKENAHELFAQADYFLLPSLKALTSKFILQTLDISNCVMSHYFAIKYHGKKLAMGTMDFIFENFLAVAKTEDFLNLSVEEIVKWIASDDIIIKDEEQVFEVIVKWMENNGNGKDQEFLQLLRHVRCIYVTRSYVFNIMLQHPLVTGSAECTKFILDTMREVSNGTDESFISQPPRDCLKIHEDAIVLCKKKTVRCYLPDEDKAYDLASKQSTHDPFSYSMSSLHNKLFVIGRNIGPIRSTDSTDTVECYDPSQNQWTTSKAPETVKDSAGTAVLQGFLYVVGGEGQNWEKLSTVEKYNPDTNQWQQMSPLSSPRSNVCAVADGSYLYAIGGINESGEYLDIVERFDPKRNSWEKLPPTHAKRAFAGGSTLKQKVFVFGGLETSSRAHPCELYDPGTNMWSTIPSDVAPRKFASAVSFQDNIYVYGTFQDEQDVEPGQPYVRSLRAYDVDRNEWSYCLRFKIRGREVCHISTLRILKDVLTKCKETSQT